MATPIGFQECWLEVKDMPLNQARNVINAKFEQRNAMEEAVRVSIVTEPQTIVEDDAREQLYEIVNVNVNCIKVINLTPGQIEDVIAFLEMRGYEYEV